MTAVLGPDTVSHSQVNQDGDQARWPSCFRNSLLPGTDYEQPNVLPTRSNSPLTETYSDSLNAQYPPIQKLLLREISVNSNQFPTLQGAS